MKGPRQKQDWLSRALARAGVMPMEEAEAAIKAGRVSINGRKATQPLTMLKPTDKVKLDGHPVSLERPLHVVMFHKPAGVLSDPAPHHGVPSVFPIFMNAVGTELARFGWHLAGRLDVNTTGLLLFTNDERVAAHITSPESRLHKRYLAEVLGELTDEKLEPIRRGVELPDGRARPAKVKITAPGQVHLWLTEGKFHQAKRMLGAVGLPVKRLHREAIGGVELDVSEGGWRLLTEEEISGGLKFDPNAEP